jgi:ActR/RegA family two-component response regulator
MFYPQSTQNNSCIMKHYDILIVDDEQRYADMLARRLGLRGLTCKVCYDGQTAIDMAAQEGFSHGHTGPALA